MGLTVQDILPKPFKVSVKGFETECKPLRLSHALIVGKLADVFQKPKDYTAKDIKIAEADMDDVIGELIPDLKGAQLGIDALGDLVSQLMASVQPSDDVELADAGVRLDTDPKVPTPQTEVTG